MDTTVFLFLPDCQELLMYRDMRSQEKKLNKIKLVLDVLGQGTVT